MLKVRFSKGFFFSDMVKEQVNWAQTEENLFTHDGDTTAQPVCFCSAVFYLNELFDMSCSKTVSKRRIGACSKTFSPGEFILGDLVCPL